MLKLLFNNPLNTTYRNEKDSGKHLHTTRVNGRESIMEAIIFANLDRINSQYQIAVSAKEI